MQRKKLDAPRVLEPKSVEFSPASRNVEKTKNSYVNRSCVADFLFDVGADFDSVSFFNADLSVLKNRLQVLHSELVRGSDELICIVGKCKIPGCDIHRITIHDDIIEHFESEKVVAEEIVKARAILNESDSSVLGVLVFSTHLEVIRVDGTVLRFSN